MRRWCLGSGDIIDGCESMTSYLTRMGCDPTGTDCVLFTALTDVTSGLTLASSWELLGLPSNLHLSDPTLSWVISPFPSTDGSTNITVTANSATAAFVTLTTLAQGRFSDNAFWLSSGASSGLSRTISFIPFGDFDAQLLATSLRVEHLQQYLP